ncbi:uncharacterized protein EDB91DRAFT_1250678 [Suillus paluster]|uniref:uncharacterized protein n=1 Tax=Suillus paluster TaxID=48578 RepID=UPI001B87DCF9|nr:uncharacterized protein EDB91DRAFT_1250678 [Suillus paluster]KAG1735149.1 hypothetical protein EDB91DRAFT_1250678 [Suillus paluster]
MTTHLFNDIEAKGAMRNYNTKPNEQMHGPLKDSYQNWTNFKNFAAQILHIDHWLLVADDIHRQVFDLDEYVKVTSQDQVNDADDIDDNTNEDDADSESDPIIHDFIPLDGSMHVKLGSRQAPQAFSLIENAHQDDDTFTNFRVKLNSFLNVFLPASNIPLPDGKRVHLPSNHTNVALSMTFSGHVYNTTVAHFSPSGFYCVSTDTTGTVKQNKWSNLEFLLAKKIALVCYPMQELEPNYLTTKGKVYSEEADWYLCRLNH